MMVRFLSRKYDEFFMELYNAGYHSIMSKGDMSLVPESLLIAKRGSDWYRPLLEHDKEQIGRILDRYYKDEWLWGPQGERDTILVYLEEEIE